MFMALIRCSECSNMVSSMAAICPKCGCPVDKMVFKNRFYLNIDRNIYEECFPIVLKIGPKIFSVDSSWAGKDCFCVAEFSLDEFPLNEDKVAIVEICFMHRDLYSYSDSNDYNMSTRYDIEFGRDCLIECKSSITKVQDRNFFVGVNVSATYVNLEKYKALPVVDLLSQEKTTNINTSIMENDTLHKSKISKKVLIEYFGDEAIVYIPRSVIGIGASAFEWHDKLKYLVLPNSITNIAADAFSQCILLKTVVLPNSVSYIGNGAFSGCQNLKKIELSNNINYIGSCAFHGCYSLRNIHIPDKLIIIEDAAFYHCGLNEAILGNDVKIIGENAFEGCKSLEKVVLSNNLKEICKSAFAGCTSIKNIILPDSLELIRRYAFGGCNALTNINIPNNVIELGEYAFCDCVKLKKVKIGKKTNTIPTRCFGNCKNLTEIEILDNVTEIADDAFMGCKKLTIFGSSNSYAEWYAKENNIKFQTV